MTSDPREGSTGCNAIVKVTDVDGGTTTTNFHLTSSSSSASSIALRLGTRRSQTKARSSSDISSVSTFNLNTVSDNSASDSSLQSVFEHVENLSKGVQSFVRRQRIDPANLMDDFVDFVGHHIVPLMNMIVNYNEAFNGARTIGNDSRALKKEFVFYSLLNSNILPIFHRIAKTINLYSCVIVCDIKERYTVCADILDFMEMARGLINSTLKADAFFENARKDRNYLSSLMGSKNDNFEAPLKIRQTLFAFDNICDRAKEWFSRIPKK